MLISNANEHSETAAIGANRLFNQITAALDLARDLYDHAINTHGQLKDTELNTEALEKLRDVIKAAELLTDYTEETASNYERSAHTMRGFIDERLAE